MRSLIRPFCLFLSHSISPPSFSWSLGQGSKFFSDLWQYQSWKLLSIITNLLSIGKQPAHVKRLEIGFVSETMVLRSLTGKLAPWCSLSSFGDILSFWTEVWTEIFSVVMVTLFPWQDVSHSKHVSVVLNVFCLFR